MNEPLFHGNYLRDALGHQTEKMLRAIEAEAEPNLLQADAAAWAEALAHHYAADCPVLKSDDVWQEKPTDTTIDVSRDPMRFITDPHSDRVRNYPAYRIVVHIPFEGDAAVFDLRPSSWTTTLPRGRVGENELLFAITFPQDAPREVDPEAQSFMNSVQMYLGWARTEIDTFNEQLARQALSAIMARRERIANRDATLATSLIPVRRVGDDGTRTFIADALVRRPSPSLPQTRSDEKPPTLEPTLADQVFDHVLEVIRQATLHMEQHPKTYAKMGEEARRDVLLSALSTHYSGFTAETDNQGGHTDIIARYDNRNLFIAECKVWAGSQGFTATVDQLFSYAGWRDTKLAIVMFVPLKALTPVLASARNALEAHAQFVRMEGAVAETELRATMHWPGDEERLADLNVFFVHTPR